MNYLNFSTILLFLIILISGCSEQKIRELEEKVNKLQNENNEIKLKLIDSDFQKKRISDLETKLFILEMTQHDEIFLDSASRGYQRINTSSGIFLVSLDDIKPYANGYKLFLRIGNISSATYKGFKFIIRYGTALDFKKMKEDGTTYEGWEKSLRKKDISFTNELEPAVWNRIEMVISPAKSDDLGYIALKMETNTLSLFDKRKLQR